MEITACPKCGSTRIFQGRLKEGVLTGFFDNYVCRDCGYHGMPVIFDDVKNYKKFLKEIKQDKKYVKKIQTKNISEVDKDKKFMKNTAMSLGFTLFVTGVLILFLGYYQTILLISAGVALFIIGFFGPSENKLKKREYKEKMGILPRIAGVILVINALVNGFLYLSMLLSFVSAGESFYFVVLFLVELFFCLFLFVAGVFALLRRRWGFAVLGSILGLFLLPVFYVPNIISFVGLVLIVFSRFVFKK